MKPDRCPHCYSGSATIRIAHKTEPNLIGKWLCIDCGHVWKDNKYKTED